jgi:hypothetical protein
MCQSAPGRRLRESRDIGKNFGPYPGETPSPTYSTAGDIVQPLFDGMSSESTRIDQEVVELPLLLPRWQAMELEAAASRRGMTTGQMLRRVIGEMLASQPLLVNS